MPAAPKSSEITSQVTVDRDVYPELHSALMTKPKNQRAEYLRALAAEAVANRARQSTYRGRRETDVAPAPAAAPAAAPAPAPSAPAPQFAPVAAPAPRHQPQAETRAEPREEAPANPAAGLPMHTLIGR